jgi:heptaprenyl diphosphate synthase
MAHPTRPGSLPAVATGSPMLGLPVAPEDLARVEAALRGSVDSVDPYLTEIASHLLLAGGKRLRPLLAVAAARAGGGSTTDNAVLGGVAIELVHLGSLYHDDVMDEADVRRGQASVNAKWGNLRAILAGDFLLARASEIAAGLGTEVAALLARTISRLCEGQIGELRTLFDSGRTVPAYLESIRGKTAAVFAAACRIGGLVGSFDRECVDTLTDYGQAFGMVFQVVDDVLDLTATEEQLGKPVGHDLVEGVYTLPVIATLAAGGGAAAELGDLLGRPIAGAELDKALAIVRSNGGIDVALQTAHQYARAAAAAARRLGPPTADALAAAPTALIATL